MSELFETLLARAAADVLREVEQQSVQWGGLAHDQEHTPSEWATFVEKQLGHILRGEDARQRYIKIAALMMCAAMAYDSNHGEALNPLRIIGLDIRTGIFPDTLLPYLSTRIDDGRFVCITRVSARESEYFFGSTRADAEKMAQLEGAKFKRHAESKK